MKYTFPPPPQAIREALEQPFQIDTGEPFHSARSAKGGMLLESLDLSAQTLDAHGEYTMGLDAVLEPDPLDHIKFLGWRSVELSSDRKVGARLLVEKAGGAELNEFNIGPFNEATIQAVKDLDTEPVEGDFQFRFLILPQIYVAAIWLHSNTRDLFKVLSPAPKNLRPSALYSAPEFFLAIKPLAQEARNSRF